MPPARSGPAGEARRLRSAPSMALLLARVGAAALPGASRLPWIGARRERSATPGGPALELQDAAVERQRLEAYERVCGFRLSDQLPATYPHVLAFPLALALLSDPGFPFSPLGLVHIHNRITQHRQLHASEQLSLRVRCSEPAPHPRGVQFALLTEVRVDGELVWEEISTNLRRGGGSEGAAAPAVRSSEALPMSACWRLSGDLGRRYAAISGDWNPIHLHPLSARLFGFPRAIAHGMWTKARCLAALEGRLPSAFTIEVAFRKPLALPATVHFAEAPVDAGIAFGVRGGRDGTPHLDGAIAFA
jgi:acyl dehydratase